jgi:serine/threonine protein kinase/WD40 repeat protein
VGDEPAADAGFPAGNEASTVIGARLGQYRLERRLGGGGMAVVYLARDERLDRPVALKVLASVLAEDEAFRKRFIRESRAAAAVEDPHIIPVFEAGEAGGMLYIAMRYVPGGDMRTMVRRDGPLPPGRAAEVIAQVASALDAAHAAGLVHRDVKPANMLVDRRSNRSDHVYLADFGLSKKRLTASAGLTGTGQFVGTLDYSAPEQIRGMPADGRTDQYALACAAFELLTAAPPFHREEVTAVMYAHLSEPPPPVTSRRAGLPPAVDQVVARALAKDPADRYASCQEFSDALLQALGTLSPSSPLEASDGPAPSHPPTQIDLVSDGSGRQPVPAASAAAGTARTPHAEADMPSRNIDIPAASAAADTAAPVPGTAPAPVDPATGHAAAGPDAGSNGTATPGRHARDDHQRPLELGPVRRSTRLSPSRAKRSRSRVWLLTVASAAIIAASATALFVSLSGGRSAPPGHRATASGHGATASDHGGAALTGALVATLGNPGSSARGVAFGPDARTLAVGSVNNNDNASGSGSGGSTYVWDIATKKITATLTGPGSEGVDYVAYGPGGTTLAAADFNGSTYLWDIATKKVTATLSDPRSKGVDSVAYAPGGTTLAAADPNGKIYLWDIATKTITATLTDPRSKGVDYVAYAPGGTTLAAADYNGNTYLWDIATKTMTATLTDPRSEGVESVAYAPGGTTLAAADSNGNTYLWDIATKTMTATLTDPGSKAVESVAYAPDGTTLAAADSNGNTYLWDIATKTMTAPLTDPESDGVYYVAFAPDGTTLAAADSNGSVYLWKLQAIHD